MPKWKNSNETFWVIFKQCVIFLFPAWQKEENHFARNANLVREGAVLSLSFWESQVLGRKSFENLLLYRSSFLARPNFAEAEKNGRGNLFTLPIKRKLLVVVLCKKKKQRILSVFWLAMSAAKCQFPFSYRRKSEEAMTAVIWLGCSRCFPLCQWNSSPSSSNEIANSQVAVLVLCIGFIGFDKLSSVCKIYLSNQAAEGAILLHSPDPTSPPPRMASFATNQPTTWGKSARTKA